MSKTLEFTQLMSCSGLDVLSQFHHYIKSLSLGLHKIYFYIVGKKIYLVPETVKWSLFWSFVIEF